MERSNCALFVNDHGQVNAVTNDAPTRFLHRHPHKNIRRRQTVPLRGNRLLQRRAGNGGEAVQEVIHGRDLLWGDGGLIALAAHQGPQGGLPQLQGGDALVCCDVHRGADRRHLARQRIDNLVPTGDIRPGTVA